MTKRTIFLFLIFCSLYVMVLAQQEESLIITTYYPSPYGSYRELSVGSSERHDGLLIVSGNVTVSGNVGIGTPRPSYRLDVGGSFGGTFNGVNKGEVQLVWCETCSTKGYYAYAVYQ